MTRADCDYLAGLDPDAARSLETVNQPGLDAATRFLGSGRAFAFLGAGASASLYPLWLPLLHELIDAAADNGLSVNAQHVARERSTLAPDTVAEYLDGELGRAAFQDIISRVFRMRYDHEGRHWTAVHEQVCRMPIRGIVTTNFDPGIVGARMRVRQRETSTGFSTWSDREGLERWVNRDIFTEQEMPILYAHGHHANVEEVVLTRADYQRAYSGKLPEVLSMLARAEHLIWIGFSFNDARVREVLRAARSAADTGGGTASALRQVALAPWPLESQASDLTALREMHRIEGRHAIFYPAWGNDHSALDRLLRRWAEEERPESTKGQLSPVNTLRLRSKPSRQPTTMWAHGAPRIGTFAGRNEQLETLDRWAVDTNVGAIGISGWGGTGKSTIVAKWLSRGIGRANTEGVFIWNFYNERSSESWADSLLDWAHFELGFRWTRSSDSPGPSEARERAVMELLRRRSLLLVLDGLEELQEQPRKGSGGRLIDDLVRRVVLASCRRNSESLLVLASRYPMSDLMPFYGTSARALELPPLLPIEGAEVLRRLGADWLDESERVEISRDVAGHALALTVMGEVLRNSILDGELRQFREAVARESRTDSRVERVLHFYSERMSDRDKLLLAALSLFPHGLNREELVEILRVPVFSEAFRDWRPEDVQSAVSHHLQGLVEMHDGVITAHPILRATFREHALPAAEAAVAICLRPLSGVVSTKKEAQRLVDAIELLVALGDLPAADRIYSKYAASGKAWTWIPAPRLGQRAASAFVNSPNMRALARKKLPARAGAYMNDAGIGALLSGDLEVAYEFLSLAAARVRELGDRWNLNFDLRNLAAAHAIGGDLSESLALAKESLLVGKRARRPTGHTDVELWQLSCRSHSVIASIRSLEGATRRADRSFRLADEYHFAYSDRGHVISGQAVKWARHLAHTERRHAARRIAEHGRTISAEHPWRHDHALFDQVLGEIHYLEGSDGPAVEHLARANELFREGGLLADLAETLPIFARSAARVAGWEEASLQAADEAVAISGRWRLLPALSSALSARATVQALVEDSKRGSHLGRARDDANEALSIARRLGLRWHELSALDVHAGLSSGVEGAKEEWESKARALRDELVPTDLDPDPLLTVERSFAQRRMAERSSR